MCCEHLDDFKEAFPERDMNSLYDELRAIGENITLHPRPRFRWDKAIIGTRDLIFPARNQVNAWEGATVVQELDEPHFSISARLCWKIGSTKRPLKTASEMQPPPMNGKALSKAG